jgi:hypothetical protein
VLAKLVPTFADRRAVAWSNLLISVPLCFTMPHFFYFFHILSLSLSIFFYLPFLLIPVVCFARYFWGCTGTKYRSHNISLDTHVGEWEALGTV